MNDLKTQSNVKKQLSKIDELEEITKEPKKISSELREPAIKHKNKKSQERIK
jgi:hypothetical protein